MNITDSHVTQHINDMHRTAAQARLAAEARAHQRLRHHPGQHLRVGATAVRRWFHRGQLGPLHNYVVS